MSKHETFYDIVKLVELGYSIPGIATAIEAKGFYTWDRFGRFLKVPPSNKADEFNEVRESVLDALAEGIRDDEIDVDYYADMFGKMPLGLSGWYESQLPNFDELMTNWNKDNAGNLSVNKPLKVAPQSKIFYVVKGLLKLLYGEDVIDDLNSGNSKLGSEIITDLQLKDAGVDVKNLKSYINKK